MGRGLTRCLPDRQTQVIQNEEDATRDEVDLNLQEEIEQENDETLEYYDLQSELILEYVAFESDENDDNKVKAIQVVPKSKLEKQLLELEKYRTAKLNRFRHGSAVQMSTFDSERGGACHTWTV